MIIIAVFDHENEEYNVENRKTLILVWATNSERETNSLLEIWQQTQTEHHHSRWKLVSTDPRACLGLFGGYNQRFSVKRKYTQQPNTSFISPMAMA